MRCRRTPTSLVGAVRARSSPGGSALPRDGVAPDFRGHLAMGEASHPGRPDIQGVASWHPDAGSSRPLHPRRQRVRVVAKHLNRLSVYPNFEGKSCYSCLTSSPAADRRAGMVAAPAIAEPVAATVTPIGPADELSRAGCSRLPAHKGDHRATLSRRAKAVVESAAYVGA
jgi:hypothetical protein